MATAYHEWATRDVTDFDRLNDAEVRVLRLLAEGHTAKSIANATGSTPAAINERLREARRKTGVGSSRELARMLRAQENRYEQIGVASSGGQPARLAERHVEPWRPQTGVFAMIALFIIAAAGAAALTSQQGPASNVVDPLIGPLPTSEISPERLHARVRAEQRDLAWAPRAEQILRNRYSRIAYVGGADNRVRVICATTLCEVAGTIDAPSRPGHEYDRSDPLNKAMRDLQDKALHDDLLKAGLDGEAGMFGGSPSKTSRMTFLHYYLRKGAAAK